MANSSTILLLNTIEWSKKLNFGRRSAIGNFLEPAMTSANIVLQMITGAPFSWRWNRVVTGFVTTAGKQDYTLLNWAATTQVQLGWLTVDNNGNSQSVTTPGTTGTSAPAWNGAKGGTTADNTGGGTAVWTNLGSIGMAVSPTYTFGWVETVSVQDTTLTPNKWFEITSQLCLASESKTARPRYISPQGDDGKGNITFRLMPVPDAAYPVAITMQEKPPLFTSVKQTWAPIPDEFSRIYNWLFLSMMWLFADDPRFEMANQKGVAALLAASEGLTQTQINIFLHNWEQVTGQPMVNAGAIQQSVQARGV